MRKSGISSLQLEIMKINNKDKQKGFTIIEMVITMFVFSIILVNATAIFVRATYLQRRAFAAEQIQSVTLAAIEAISRDIRVSELCTIPNTCSSALIQMEHPTDGDVRYLHNSVTGVIRKYIAGNWVDFTSTEVFYSSMIFIYDGIGPDCRQPKVTLSLTVRSKTNPIIESVIQTATTSRNAQEEIYTPPVTCP